MVNKLLPQQVVIGKVINIRYRTNHKEFRWCKGCGDTSIFAGQDYFKVWDNRLNDESHASYCVECFKKTEYNDIYQTVAKREGLKQLMEIINKGATE